jgi:hypothetical protein
MERAEYVIEVRPAGATWQTWFTVGAQSFPVGSSYPADEPDGAKWYAAQLHEALKRTSAAGSVAAGSIYHARRVPPKPHERPAANP